MPSDEVLIEIEKLEPFFGPAKEFLEDQVAAYLLRTGSGLNKPPRAPFFANSYLVAESSLEYLTTWRDKLRFIINAGSSHETFAGMMRSDILSGEVQWLEGALSYGPPDPAAMKPSVWWMIASVNLGRFKGYSSIHETWTEGTAPCLSAMLRPKPIMEVLSYEKARLASSKPLRELLFEAAATAIEEATYGWLQQHKIGTVIKEDMHFQLVSNNVEFAEKVNGAIIVASSVSLADRDRRLRKLVGDYAVKQDLEVLPAYWWKSEESEEEDAPKRPPATRHGPDLNDLMAGFVASSQSLDRTADD